MAVCTESFIDAIEASFHQGTELASLINYIISILTRKAYLLADTKCTSRNEVCAVKTPFISLIEEEVSMTRYALSW